MNEIPEIQEDLSVGGKTKNWLQDNIRIILSVLIVVAIAAGIYSYSKRTEPTMEEEVAISETTEEEMLAEEEVPVTIIGEEEAKIEEEIAPEEVKTEVAEVEKEVVVPAEEQKTEVATGISEESNESFIETATVGDSRTTLARKALRNYLEKNNDSSLTAEHKVYIEDYLRKNVAPTVSVKSGDKMSFSKNLIKDSIEKAKTLSEAQLKNLEKYSQRVTSI